MNKLRNTQTLKEESVRVRYLTAVLSVALNFHPYNDKPSVDLLFQMQKQIDRKLLLSFSHDRILSMPLAA